MIEKKEISVKCIDGTEKAFLISKFPAIAGREIVTQYPISNIPKVGSYKVSEEIMLKLMCYVGVELEGGTVQMLTTKVLVDNHVPDWEALGRIEVAMLGHNTSFFLKGKISSFSDTIKANAGQLISSTLTDLLAQLSQQNKQPKKS